jgi:hypothetical protein
MVSGGAADFAAVRSLRKLTPHGSGRQTTACHIIHNGPTHLPSTACGTTVGNATGTGNTYVRLRLIGQRRLALIHRVAEVKAECTPETYM